jgi:carboxypeptidase C (cathepsin A)
MKSCVCLLVLTLLVPAAVSGRVSGANEPNASRTPGSPPGTSQGSGTDSPTLNRDSPTQHAVLGAPAQPRTPRQTARTTHALFLSGQTFHYRATAGYLPLEDSSGKPLAEMFFVAYEQADVGAVPSTDSQGLVSDSSRGADLPSAIHNPRSVRRPITFAFNGGPGASSVWLHMGGLGPKRVVLAGNGTALPEADRLVDNEYTWLEFTDLVFVDPVGTGFSRPAPGVEAGQFYEVQKDIEANATFIRLFVTKYGRWLSPQFIVGESYGTTRAAGLARYLQQQYALYLDGLILLSSALNMEAISFDPGNDLPYVLSLPSYTAVAAYHGKLGEKTPLDLPRALDRVSTWALEDYLPALARGRLLPAKQFREVARHLAEYTGLEEDTIARNDLRISVFDFIGDLLRSENQVLGLLDGRVTAPAGRSGPRSWTDPSLFIVEGPFVATFHDYLRTDLGFRTGRRYIFLSDEANETWKWGQGRLGYLNVAPRLAEAMRLDRRLEVFAGAGYYDLTTPWLSQSYVYDHLDLPPDRRGHLTFQLYYSGHQIYTSPDALAQLTRDVRAFVTEHSAR